MNKKLLTALDAARLDYRPVKIYLDNDNTCNGILVSHNYCGCYPSEDALRKHEETMRIARRFSLKAEKRGYYISTLIYC